MLVSVSALSFSGFVTSSPYLILGHDDVDWYLLFYGTTGIWFQASIKHAVHIWSSLWSLRGWDCSHHKGLAFDHARYDHPR